LTLEDIIQKLRRPGQEERVANKTPKDTGVSLMKGTGLWQAQCQSGGKMTFLGHSGSVEEAARVWDRMRLLACKADGTRKEEVHLSFPLTYYTDDEVTALQGCTQEDIIKKLRRAAEQSRSECRAKAVELPPVSPRPFAVKRGAAGVVPGVEAAAGQLPLKKSKATE
jgi:hypothetical protein